MNKTFFASLPTILLLSVVSASAQSSSVTIAATDAHAAESGPDTGTLLVRRSGDMNLPLTVFYRTGGTASNGVDYQSLSNSVTIPPGAATATIVITPIDDSLVEGNESVLVRLAPPLTPNVPVGGNYGIIAPDTAFVIIADNDRAETNEAPFVRLNEPQNGEVFAASADVVVRAYAQDREDSSDLKVEFLEGTNSLGFGIFVPALCPAPYCPYYQLTWSNVPPGDYVLTAVATDSGGASSRSDPVHLRVVGTNQPTLVNIAATDPGAAEPDEDPQMERPTILNIGVFTVTRSSYTNIDLPVYYRLTGSASNGVDYASLSGRVIIPAGFWSARIEVDPIDDALVEGTETVIATVEPPVCIAIHPPPPECYQVGSNNRATVFIGDNDPNTPSNLPPAVRITAPVDGEAFREGSDITIDAVTTDKDGYAPRVEFFANGHKIGEQEIVFIQAPPDGEPIYFSFVWTNVMAGNYTLTARATDTQGATGVSSPVHILVGGTSAPPIVTIRASDPYAVEGRRLGGTNTSSPGNTAPGTNAALFAIHRSGETNSALTVFYSISGTASNGVDYVRIGDAVTIPAGRRLARVVIAPIDDAVVEQDETVVLTLQLPSSPSNTSSTYVIGRPRRAAAVIADDDRPRPICQRLSDGLFHLCLPGTNNDCFSVHTTSNFLNWTALGTNIVIDGAIHYVDPDAVELPQRFYRVRPEAQPPPEE